MGVFWESSGTLAHVSRTEKAFIPPYSSPVYQFSEFLGTGLVSGLPTGSACLSEGFENFKHTRCQNEPDLKKLTSFIVSFTAALQLSILVQHNW